MSERVFEKEFVFGVATAAYQVEGGIENDWADWERDGKLLDPDARCGRAIDHWSRFDEDLELVKKLGAGAFRISIEWARVEPEPGRIDEEVVAEYRRRVLAMERAGIRPVITLHHFTHPKWFHARCPWHKPASVDAFRAYSKVCARILEGTDAMIVTLNEPMVLLLGGYVEGLMPPGIADAVVSMEALANMARAHVAAREELRAVLPSCQMGISQNCVAFAPHRPWHPLDRALVKLGNQNYNHAFMEALVTGRLRLNMPGLARIDVTIPGAKGSIDYVGMNYYTRAHLKFIPTAPHMTFEYRDMEDRGLTDIGWEIYPEGFLDLLMEMSRYDLPIWITENGLDDRKGDRRPYHLYNHLTHLAEAKRRGVDIRGYLHWSLVDNFEWLEAWGPRFGLYRVDFDTLERTPTPACDYYRHIATTGRLPTPGEFEEGRAAGAGASNARPTPGANGVKGRSKKGRRNAVKASEASAPNHVRATTKAPEELDRAARTGTKEAGPDAEAEVAPSEKPGPRVV